MPISKRLGQRKRAARRRYLRVELLENRRLLAGDLSLLKDIAPGSDWSTPFLLAENSDGVLIGANWDELWFSNGTSEGTQQIAAEFSASAPHLSLNDRGRTAVLDNQIFFGGYTQVNGDFGVGGAWVSDGTSAGTQRIGAQSIDYGDAEELTATTSNVFFVGGGASGGEARRLWAINGTTLELTELLSVNLNPGFSGGFRAIGNLFAAGDQLYFTAYDVTAGHELWTSDGTLQGTQRLSDFIAGPLPGPGSFALSYTTAVGNRILLTAVDSTDVERWGVSDGTSVGTELLELRVNSGGSNTLQSVVGIGPHALFVARENAGSEPALFMSNGTVSGTSAVAGLPGSVDGLISLGDRAIVGLTVYDSVLQQNVQQYFATDGTSHEVLNVFGASFVESGSYPPLVLGDRVYYIDQDANMWVTDGTNAGTKQLLASIEGRNWGDSPIRGQRVLDQVVLRLEWGGRNIDIVTHDLSPDTVELTGTLAIRQDIDPNLMHIGSNVLVVGGDETYGEEVWRIGLQTPPLALPFVVSTTLDVVDPDDNLTSLREAIANANAEPGVQEITFDLPSDSVLELTAGQLAITDSVRIVGLGRDELTIDASGLSRLFEVSASQILTIEDLTLTGGSAQDGGAISGGLNSRIILQDARLADNAATRHGGGIYTIGAVEVLGSQLIDNTASSDGGAIHRAGTSGSRNVTIRESELIGNTSGHRGGAVFLQDSGLNIYDSVFESNASQQAGGAISTGGGTAYTGFYVSGTAFLNNSARETGGAINMVNHSYFTVLDSLFEGNQVSDSLRPGWYSSFGGAIHISKGWFGESAFVRTTINRTTFVSNSALGPSGSGGAISVQGGETTILNSTISRNQALSGGGIRVFSGSISGIGTTLGLDHVTITNNTATGFGAGGGIAAGDATTSHNSIISGNMATVLGGHGIDVTGPLLATSSYNIIGHQNYGTLLVNGVNGNQVGVMDPGLAPLADNGGLTWTHALLPSSPAVNAGNPASTLLTDQRGVGRQGIPDIGAFEFESPFVVTTTQDVVDPDDGLISLREAVTNANNAAGLNQIEFALPAGSVVSLTAGQLSITDETTIIGLGRDELTIDAGGLSRIFEVSASQILTIEDLTLTGGSAEDGGAIMGGLNSLIVLQDARLTTNAATRHGGGIYSTGRVEVIGSQLIENTAGSDGGAIHQAGTSGSRGVTVSDSEFDDNTAGRAGGAIYLQDSPLSIADSLFDGNTSQQAGGAINANGYHSRSISRTEFLSNAARGAGGAISSVNHSSLIVVDSLFAGNAVRTGGNYDSFGGAIHAAKAFFGGGAVRTTIERSTFENNAALESHGAGGAITTGAGEMNIRNSTLSGNQAASGGGIRVFSGAISGNHSTLNLDHVTITNNTATGFGGGGGISAADFSTVHSSIIAGNHWTSSGSGGIDVSGNFLSASSYNIIGQQQSGGSELVNGVNGNQVGVTDPGLAPLADNGGLTKTHALLPSSPAINAGNPASTLLTDQRGFARVDVPDIGAFESDVLPDSPLRFEIISGNLEIEDLAGENDQWRLSRDADDVVLLDVANADAELGRVPFADITGQILVMAAGGNDELTIDLTAGDLIPSGGLSFDGGDGDDDLQILDNGGTATYTPGTVNSNSGSVLLDEGLVTYTNVSPQTLTMTGSDDLTVQLPNGLTSEIFVEQSTTAGQMQVRSQSLEFTTFVFSPPTIGLTLLGGSAGETITIASFPENVFPGSLTLSGGGGNDTIRLNGNVTFAADQHLQVTAETVTVGAAAAFETQGSGDIVVTTNSMTISTTGNLSSADQVVIHPQTSGRAINLGSKVADQLSLTDAELDRITAGTLQISNTSSGDIIVSGAITRADDTSLSVVSGTRITVNASITVGEAAGLNLEANHWVNIFAVANVNLSAGSGGVRMLGAGQTTAFQLPAVRIWNGASITTTNNGDIHIEGDGTGHSVGFNYGVFIGSDSIVHAGGSGQVEIYGTGGVGGSWNIGVYIREGAEILTDSGNIVIEGTGGGTASSEGNYGVLVSDSLIEAGGTGELLVNGTGGPGSGNDNVGVYVGGSALVTTNGGNVTISGTGGGTGSSGDNQGVLVTTQAVVTSGGLGQVTVTGNAGSGSSAASVGVLVSEADSRITSSGGSVIVHGTGGASGSGGDNHGIQVLNGAEISAGGMGTVSIDGQGGGGSNASGQNYGVSLETADALITSAGGAVSVVGRGGSSRGNVSGNMGVHLNDGAMISAGGLGDVTVTGIGGAGATSESSSHHGVSLAGGTGGGAMITSSGGDVQVTGTGGGAGSSFNYGVVVFAGGTIQAGATGSVSVIGNGGSNAGVGSTTRSSNIGVMVSGATAEITSNGGSVSVTGTGGKGTGSSQTNSGVRVESGGVVTAGVGGAVTVQGTGGAGTGNGNVGVWVIGDDSQITSDSGDVAVTGWGGGTGGASGNNHGVLVQGGGKVGGFGTTLSVRGFGGVARDGHSASGVFVTGAGSEITSGSGSVLVEGTGGNIGGPLGLNVGVYLQDNGRISSTGPGDVTVTGLAGSVPGNILHGVYLVSAGNITASGSGNVFVTGTGSPLGSSSNHGVFITGTDSQIRSDSGAIQVTGIEGGGSSSQGIHIGTGGLIESISGNVTLVANTMELLSAESVRANESNTVTLVQRTASRAIGVGAADSGTQLGLTDAELDRITAGLVQIGDSMSGNITVSAAITHGNNLSLTSGGGITFNQSVTMAANKSFTAESLSTTTGIVLANANSDIATSGTGAIALTAARNIQTSAGSSVVTVDGDIELRANRLTAATGGNFVGIDINNANISSSSGNILLDGRGGNTGIQQHGVYVRNSGKVGVGTVGAVTVTGLGGASSSNFNHGVYVSGSGSAITSGGGTVLVDGFGGGTATSVANYGVWLDETGKITSAGTGVDATVTVLGQGGATSGNQNYGVYVGTLNAEITSSGGAVRVEGIGGGLSGSAGNYGVVVAYTGKVTSAGTATGATVTVEGIGGNTAGNANRGVYLLESGSISSSGGNVAVSGTGRGTGSSGDNHGVYVHTRSIVSAGGLGQVTVTGNAGSGSSVASVGVLVSEADSRITSSGGSVIVDGTGGVSGSGGDNHGVHVLNGAEISAAGMGTVNVEGRGGNSSGARNIGVWSDGGTINSEGGEVNIVGTGGGGESSFDNYGVYVTAAGAIVGGGSGQVTVSGQGGLNASHWNYGVRVDGATSMISSEDGDVAVRGIGGGITSNLGVLITNSGQISAGGMGLVTVEGTGGGTGAGVNNHGLAVWSNGQITSGGGNVIATGQGGAGTGGSHLGIWIDGATSMITSGGMGSVTVVGTAANAHGIRITRSGEITSGGSIYVSAVGSASSEGLRMEDGTRIASGGDADVTVIADSVNLLGTSSISSGSGTTTLIPRSAGTRINLGGADVLSGGSMSLGLTDAELDRITAGTLQIGDSASGEITVSAAITHGNNLSLRTGDGITFNQSVTMTADRSFTAESLSTAKGILLANASADIVTSGSGAVSVTAARNIEMQAGSSMTTVNGGITLSANQQATPVNAEFSGIMLEGASILTSGSGEISIAGSTGTVVVLGHRSGVQLRNGSLVESTSTAPEAGAITIEGNDLAGHDQNDGVLLYNAFQSAAATPRIRSASGAISVTGTAAGDDGVQLFGQSEVAATGSATITIVGTAGSGSHGGAVMISGDPGHAAGLGASISSASGAIQISSLQRIIHLLNNGNVTSSSGPIAFTSDAITLDSSASVSTSDTVTLMQKTPGHAINIGGADSDTQLGLTDAELDRIFAAALIIGNADSGTITVSDIVSRPASTAMELHTGGNILLSPGSIDTAGGDLQLTTAETGRVVPLRTGTDLSAGTVTMDSTVRLELAGTTEDSGYQRLVVDGDVHLTGTGLELTGAYVPQPGDAFTIISANNITGNFEGLADGAGVMFNGVNLQVEYAATSVTLVVPVVNSPPTDITLSSSSINENTPTSDAVTIGMLASIDPDETDSFAYSLVAGDGSNDVDNEKFQIVGDSLQIKSGESIDFEVKAEYKILVRTEDSGGLTFAKAFTISVIDLPEFAGPIVIGDGTAQRSLVNQVVITFDGDVEIEDGAFHVLKRGEDVGDVETSWTSQLNSLGQSVVTLTFSGEFTRGSFQALEDGYYQLTVDGTKIRRVGQYLDSNNDGAGGDTFVLGDRPEDAFFALYGDVNGDGGVGIADLSALRKTYGKQPGDLDYNPILDFDGSGIGLLELAEFRKRFGKLLGWT